METSGPLAGIRVLDLTRALSGPFATMILGDLGADVIKVEDTWHGDDTRRWGPPFQGDDAAYFLSINRNKRGVSVNLKTPEGRDIAQRLAGGSDILMENFRPGTAARLGLGYEELSQSNPGLIYASISGYGQTGPSADLPGYDAVAQAVSGMMSVTGEAGGEPVRSGTSLADVGAGMWALVGILAALHARHATGRGQLIDISLLDGQVAWLTYVAGKYFATGVTPGRHGSAHESLAPYQVFPTADDPLMVAVGSDGLWQRFTAATGLDELTSDPRYATNPDRVKNRDTLIPRITRALAARGCAEWAGRLNAAGVPAGPVNTVPAALEQPQVAAREMVVELEHPVAGMLRMLGTPLKLSAQPASIRRPPPVLGQHTDEILAEAGYPAARIAELRQAGVIRLPQTTPRNKMRRSASRSRMLAWTLTRPDIHMRAMLAGVAASDTTSSLFAVSLMSAGGSSSTSLTGSAPCSEILVMNVMPRSVTWQLNERLLKKLDRSCSGISPNRLVRACSASRHSSAVAMRASLLSASDGSVQPEGSADDRRTPRRKPKP
jgi:crotonobetainyl-CoA:carnitine CoA-transferase CaiB-like acyl-CoA transferase